MFLHVSHEPESPRAEDARSPNKRSRFESSEGCFEGFEGAARVARFAHGSHCALQAASGALPRAARARVAWRGPGPGPFLSVLISSL